MLKKLGVIGGMGPEATSFYYARVTEIPCKPINYLL